MAAENAYKYNYAYGYEPAYAPERKPEVQPEKRPDLKKVRKRKIDIDRQNERSVNRKLAKIVAVMCVFFTLFAVACNSFAERAQAKQDLDAIKQEYTFAQAQNRELNVKLNNLISAENIDRIAVEKLGLVKVAPGNEIYMDENAENHVVFSRGK